jgi:hypothetical protein
MNAQRILGILEVAVGIILLTLGINASHSVADQVSGILLAALGALMAIFGVR